MNYKRMSKPQHELFQLLLNLDIFFGVLNRFQASFLVAPTREAREKMACFIVRKAYLDPVRNFRVGFIVRAIRKDFFRTFRQKNCYGDCATFGCAIF